MSPRVLLLVLMACGDPHYVPVDAAGQRPTDAGGQETADAATSSSAEDINASGTRIKMRVLVTDDGARSLLGWHDAQRNEDCVFTLASDGVMRCLPYSGATVSYFSDAACAVPLAVTAAPCPAGNAPPTAVQFRTSSTCPPVNLLAIWTIGVAYHGDAYARGGANCVKVTSPDGFWTVGSEIPPSQFAAATEQLVQ